MVQDAGTGERASWDDLARQLAVSRARVTQVLGPLLIVCNFQKVRRSSGGTPCRRWN
jgi:hypothetical protein